MKKYTIILVFLSIVVGTIWDTLLMILFSRRIHHISSQVISFANNELDFNLSQKMGIDAIEVTETTLMQDPVMAKYELNLLDKLNVSLSIDDFGTGYSSLAYLKHLPVHEVKIDQIFIKNLMTNPSDGIIVRAVLGLAQSLKLKVVAEGVENKTIHNRLAHFSCDITQGYCLSKPMPFDQVVAFNLDHMGIA